MYNNDLMNFLLDILIWC